MAECSVQVRPWGELTTAELYGFLKLRTDVFFVEQKIDEEELDYRDLEPTTLHYWIAEGPTLPVTNDASASGVRAVGNAAHAIAYLRVLYDETPTHLDAHRIVGRVVVRADHRGEGLAQRLLTRVFEEFPGEPLLLHSQEYIAPLYAKVGFVAFGEVYVEAGIPHISMYRA